jgi:cytochrome d ubiquinol oxidase subunit II
MNGPSNLPSSTIAAVILWFGVTCYAILGGVDYGAGFWDLTAGGAKRGARPRALIDQAITPVWEIHNVWLIFALVVLWTAFPRASASIRSTLFVPIALAAAGIFLRGCAVVFRKAIQARAARRFFGATFALSSLLTPFFLGAAFGAVASGRVEAGDPGGDSLSAWVGPTPLLIGALAVLCAAFLAAVFLVSEAGRAGDVALERYFRRRAIGSAVAVGVLAIAGAYVLERDAPFVFEGLVRAGQPFIFFSAAGGVGCVTLIASGITRGARGLAIGAVVAVLGGWGVAQYPYLLPTSLSIAEGAGAPATLRRVLVGSAIALATLVPALALLFARDRRGRMEERSKQRHSGVIADDGRPPEVRPDWWSHVPSR